MITAPFQRNDAPSGTLESSPKRFFAHRLTSTPAHGDETQYPQTCDLSDVVHPVVEMYPPNAADRRALTHNGIWAEVIEIASPEKVELHFQGQVHLLVAYESGERRDGESRVEGVPRSTLRSLTRKFTFVPAGNALREWHEPRARMRMMYFYFDPANLNIRADAAASDSCLAPRLFYEDATSWDTIYKLMSLVERPVSDDRRYFEALGIVLLHEIVRVHGVHRSTRGGLAAWQQRVVTVYIEKHLAERIPLAKLARLVRLSPNHFCRAFKEAFGAPPSRYHMNCRIENAKQLLENSTFSMTEIGLMMGFCDASSFTTAFRKATGLTPTHYQRNIA